MANRSSITKHSGLLLIGGGAIVAITLTAAFLTVESILQGDTTGANNLAGVSSAFATILLVGLTGWYTWETRRLVDQGEELKEEERGIQRNQVRRALLSELYAMEYFFKIFDEGTPNLDHEAIEEFTELASTNVYDSASIEMGLLSSSEVESVSRFYNMMKAARTNLIMAATTVKAQNGVKPDDLEEVSHSLITRANRLWGQAILTLEESLPESARENSRELVQLEMDESTYEEPDIELTELDQNILRCIWERGAGTPEGLTEKIDDTSVEEVVKRCDILVEAGELVRFNDVYTPPPGAY